MGGSRPNDRLRTKFFFWKYLKCIITPCYMYSRSPHCQWQTHKCLGSGFCCRETFRKLLTRGTRAKNGGFSVSYAVRTAHATGRIYTANQQYWWKENAPKGCILGVSAHHMLVTPNGVPKPEKFGSQEFISSVVSDVEKKPLNSVVKIFVKFDQNSGCLLRLSGSMLLCFYSVYFAKLS